MRVFDEFRSQDSGKQADVAMVLRTLLAEDECMKTTRIECTVQWCMARDCSFFNPPMYDCATPTIQYPDILVASGHWTRPATPVSQESRHAGAAVSTGGRRLDSNAQLRPKKQAKATRPSYPHTLIPFSNNLTRIPRGWTGGRSLLPSGHVSVTSCAHQYAGVRYLPMLFLDAKLPPPTFFCRVGFVLVYIWLCDSMALICRSLPIDKTRSPDSQTEWAVHPGRPSTTGCLLKWPST
jgi:hypothetical protein